MCYNHNGLSPGGPLSLSFFFSLFFCSCSLSICTTLYFCLLHRMARAPSPPSFFCCALPHLRPQVRLRMLSPHFARRLSDRPAAFSSAGRPRQRQRPVHSRRHYARGQGVPQNYAEAVKWYRLAADQGNAFAQYNLGLMYANGEGVPQNYAEALKWYRLAADQGNAFAQINLGVMYARWPGRAAELRRGGEVVSPRRRPRRSRRSVNLGVMYSVGRWRAAELRRGDEVVSPRRRPGQCRRAVQSRAHVLPMAMACRRTTPRR